ncbi:MAG: tyrosine--tRNA ligase [Anaeroplasmataceae bacterium]
MTLLEELKWREVFFDSTDKENIENYLEKGEGSFYLGADPTGKSLHVGHLAIYITALRLKNKGFKPVLLIGGATGSIGDPKQQGERKMLTMEDVNDNVKSLSNQICELFKIDSVVNNYDWISKIDVLTFLRDYGKNFNVSYMINKDTVKSRLDSGISYTEFSYQILQALDFLHLYENMNVTMQIGGQDQWGNITSGSELIRKKLGSDKKVYGLTFALITKSDGTKFGKSEGGESVWLDKNMTSPYAFYQFWINTSDTDVIKRLKQFTFLSKEEIDEIENKHSEKPELRIAQKKLAYEVTSFVHGVNETNKAIKISDALFSEELSKLTSEEIEIGFSDLFKFKSETEISLVDALISLKLASSKRESREFISSGAVYINGVKNQDLNLLLTKNMAISNKYIIVRRGKKKYALLEL